MTRTDIIHGYASGAAEKHPRLVIAVLMLITLGLSLFVFSQQSLRLDEAQSLWQTSHTPAKMISIIAQDVHVPLYHILLHGWQFLFGNNIETARLLSLVFFLMTIPGIYLLGKTAYNNSVGIFAALLLSISPFMNWYGNELRMYSLFTLLAIANQYFFIRILRHCEMPYHRYLWWGYGITALLGLFTHYFFGFALLSQVIFFFLYKKEFPPEALSKFIATGLTVGILFSPWLGYVYSLGSASNMRPLIEAPTSINVFNTFSQFLFGFQDNHINTILVSLWPLSVLLVFLSLRSGKRTRPESIYFLMAVLIPITAVFAISATIRPIFLTRYLILTLPSLYLIISWLLWTYPPRLAFVVKSGLVIVVVMTLIVEVVSAGTPVKENYREASLYLTERATPRDIIVVSAPFTIYPVEYYYRGNASLETLPRWDRYTQGPVPPYIESKIPSEVAAIKANHDVLWLLLSYDQGYEQKIRHYFDSNYERLESKTFSPGLTLHAYKLY